MFLTSLTLLLCCNITNRKYWLQCSYSCIITGEIRYDICSGTDSQRYGNWANTTAIAVIKGAPFIFIEDSIKNSIRFDCIVSSVVMNSLNSCAHILDYFTVSGIIVRYGYGCLNKIKQIACRQPFMVDYMAFGQRFFRYVFVKFRTRKQLTCSIEYIYKYPQTPVAKKISGWLRNYMWWKHSPCLPGWNKKQCLINILYRCAVNQTYLCDIIER